MPFLPGPHWPEFGLMSTPATRPGTQSVFPQSVTWQIKSEVLLLQKKGRTDIGGQLAASSQEGREKDVEKRVKTGRQSKMTPDLQEVDPGRTGWETHTLP